MVIMQFRVILLRRHKTVTFIDGIVNGTVQNFMLQNCLTMPSLNIGDIVCVECRKEMNRSQKEVWVIYRLQLVSECSGGVSYSINNIKDQLKRNRIKALLGGSNLNIWLFRNRFIDELRKLMYEFGMISANSTLLMDYRGTSTAIPFECWAKYTGKKYMKITHEVELKKAAILTLSSVFDLSYVYRDVYDTKKRLSEIMLLEGILISDDPEVLVDILLAICKRAIELAKAMAIDYDDRFEHITVLDASKEISKAVISAPKKYKEYLNSIDYPTIIINSPIDSPFVKADKNGCKKEVKFIVNGTSPYHGYVDENSYDKLYAEFNFQLQDLEEEVSENALPIDFLDILKYGSPNTVSFGMGLDRFVTQLLMCGNIYDVAHSLGL